MKKVAKRILSFLLVALFLISVIPFSVSANSSNSKIDVSAGKISFSFDELKALFPEAKLTTAIKMLHSKGITQSR